MSRIYPWSDFSTNKQINGKSIQKDKDHTDETQRNLAQESLKFRFVLNDGSQ